MIYRRTTCLVATLLMALVTAAVSAPDADDAEWVSVFEKWRGHMAIDSEGRTMTMLTRERFDTEEECMAFLRSPLVVGSVQLMLADAQAEDYSAVVRTYCVQGEPI